MRSLIAARQGRIARVEAKTLGDVSGDKYRLEDGTSVVPWDFRLFLVPIWAGGDTQNGLTRYYGLAREARIEAHRARNREPETTEGTVFQSVEVWEARLRELGLYVAATLVGMKDNATAIDHLKAFYSTLKSSGGEANISFSHRVAIALAFVYLMIGDTISAREWFQLAPVEQSKELSLAVCSLADGDMSESASLLEKYLSTENNESEQQSKPSAGDDAKTQALNNLAISELHQGNLVKAIELLEQTVTTANVDPAVLFNLFILYDLQHELPATKKRLIADKIRSRGIESLGTYELFLQR
ncbi:hypothetical protein AWJ20_553 [Sugiyamaella lignohabitans]|uniref:Uncharacterized protein n=1 Tax=Sugiyamaella lignohabitans TaxID=796027 RepID=A0A167CZV4_9ASCO|nr:uncharacterized protein AWJ20_553 [Sugiyamaella lignohabitans]ANB12304.1 hypothetical protein AWJ20_553 [Sugiyamaella lignohabitans]